MPKIGPASPLGKSIATFPRGPSPLARTHPPTHTPTSMRRFRTLLALLVLVIVVGCAPDEERPAEATPGDTVPEAVAPEGEPGDPEGGWDRDIVFLHSDADEPLLLAWHFRQTLEGEGARWLRSLRVRSVTGWESVLDDTLRVPRSRAPWRIVPGGGVAIVVETDDALSSLLYADGPRSAEVSFDEFLAEWSRPEGGAFRIFRATGIVPEPSGVEGTGTGPELREREGLVLDLTRAWSAGETPPGDWIFLEAGAGTHLIMEERSGTPPPASPALEPEDDTEAPLHAIRFRGWSRVAFQAQPWPELRVEWIETRAFERARRDIPQRWRISSAGGEVEGEVEATSSHLHAGEGEGPLLPVRAYFDVEGEMRIDGESIPVRGVIRHVQR